MLEVNKMSEAKKELHNFITNMPEMYAEKALNILQALTQPTGAEIETDNMKRWWKDNIESKEPEELSLSPEELEEIQNGEIVKWDTFDKDCGKE